MEGNKRKGTLILCKYVKCKIKFSSFDNESCVLSFELESCTNLLLSIEAASNVCNKILEGIILLYCRKITHRNRIKSFKGITDSFILDGT